MKEILYILEQLIKNNNTIPENINKSMAFCANWLRSKGINVEILENRGLKMLVSTVGEKGPTIILNGHIDVVPGDPEDFIPRMEENRFYGRGSYDMLGSVATMMKLVEELSTMDLECKVMLVIVPDEEQGGPLGTGYLVENGYLGDMVICGEPTNLNISIEAKGIIHLEAEIPGNAAHASRPWLGENAILTAYKWYKKLLELNIPEKKTDFFDKPSFNLSTISGGAALNQVPDSCVIGVDIRYLPGQNPDDLINQIKNINPSATVNIIRQGAPVNTKKQNPFVQQLYESTKSIIGDEVVFFGQEGTADTRYYAMHGIPAVEFGPVGANHHGRNEYVELDSLDRYKQILKNYILNLKHLRERSILNEVKK